MYIYTDEVEGVSMLTGESYSRLGEIIPIYNLVNFIESIQKRKSRAKEGV